jgi:hypothetical protein
MVFNAPRYVSNHTLHKDSKIQFVNDEFNRMTNSNEGVVVPGQPAMVGKGRSADFRCDERYT